MKEDTVRYHFQFKDRDVEFAVETQPRESQVGGRHPDWALLEFNQCACCPLKKADCQYCPAATRINDVLESFANDKSTEPVKVTVETPERTYWDECDLQVGIHSLMGLMLATSGCPVLKDLGAMASFHIPFCTTRETLHRSVGSYLIKQYFKQLEGAEADWELVHLKELYDVLEGLNRDFSRRVQASISSDAVSNAVIMFFATSVVVASSLESQLKRHQNYLTNDGFGSILGAD